MGSNIVTLLWNLKLISNIRQPQFKYPSVMFVKGWHKSLWTFVLHQVTPVDLNRADWLNEWLIDCLAALSLTWQSLLTDSNKRVLSCASPRWRRSSSLPRAGGDEASIELPRAPSCRRCTSRCSPSAASPRSVWWRDRCRGLFPLWSARNCRCWRSSGRFLEAPDTPRRAGPWSLSDSYLMMSETGHRPHHLHLYAATHTGNDIIIRWERLPPGRHNF